MHDRPSVEELIEAARLHLVQEVVPSLAEPRLSFRTLVAANVLAVAGRELTLFPSQAPAEWQRLAYLLNADRPRPANPSELLDQIAAMSAELCRQIEQGDFDPPERWLLLLDHCRETAAEKLAVANPAFLARVMAEESSGGG